MEITGFNKKLVLPIFSCLQSKQKKLIELAKIRKFHFSSQKIWRNKAATENYF